MVCPLKAQIGIVPDLLPFLNFLARLPSLFLDGLGTLLTLRIWHLFSLCLECSPLKCHSPCSLTSKSLRPPWWAWPIKNCAISSSIPNFPLNFFSVVLCLLECSMRIAFWSCSPIYLQCLRVQCWKRNDVPINTYGEVNVFSEKQELYIWIWNTGASFPGRTEVGSKKFTEGRVQELS